MRTFQVYFKDGNQKLFESDNIGNVCMYIACGIEYQIEDVICIKEV